MIKITGLCRSFNGRDILKNIDLEIEQGSFTVIAGANGSGKSTLIKHMNAILTPERGSVVVDDMDTRDRSRLFDIRERVGMVFQNPDSQSVASIVEDDTAFAPENLGLDEAETARRVEFALNAAGISGLRSRLINTLSGGQKQLAAISGILAMRPKYMVFDEATSMLDPAARRRVSDCVKRLRRELSIAVIWVTHYMDEAAEADRLIVLDNGQIAADGAPREIFSDAELTARCALELPPCAALGARLGKLTPLPLTVAECAEAILKLTEARE
ncbi:MAG: ATP-binding cassette domain-containing protein [Clostridia bacterium]|nr:ATP-binding cassette domain-containing protein [Clostridia bacterium]